MTDNKLTVETQEDGAVLTIAVIGRLDSNTVRNLDSTVQELADNEQPAVVFDLERMSYVSSAGLRIFLVAAKQPRKAGGKAVFCNLPEGVERVFKVSGFSHILTLSKTREEALAHF